MALACQAPSRAASRRPAGFPTEHNRTLFLGEGGWSAGAFAHDSPQPSALSPQPSALSPQPSALSPQPSALSPQPSALSPQPSALSPQPSALSPQPSALSPQPSALSPQPSALSPQPSALSPQPSALSPDARTVRAPRAAEPRALVNRNVAPVGWERRTGACRAGEEPTHAGSAPECTVGPMRRRGGARPRAIAPRMAT